VQRLQFDSSPLFILPCVVIALGYAVLLYGRKHTWGNAINGLLFALRTAVVFFILALLLGPLLKFTNNTIEKPTIVFLLDNSTSIKQVLDSVKLRDLDDRIASVKDKVQEAGYQVRVKNFSGKEGGFRDGSFLTSDLTSALKKVNEEFEGKNLTQLVLVSDGVYNSGVSPLYTPFSVPISTVGIGDSTQRKDVILRNLVYNKIVYQGNKYPLRAELIIQKLVNKELTISVFQAGKKITSVKQIATKPVIDIDFQLPATKKGLQRVEVVVDAVEGESNLKNNRLTAYIEVVEGKKKILLVAPAPHPDIKALRNVIEKNDNYELTVYIPNLSTINETLLQPSSNDLLIFHQVADKQNQTSALLSKLKWGASGVLFMIGEQSNLFQLKTLEIPLKFENLSQRDEVTPSLNNHFKDFTFSEAVAHVSKFPPISVPFGKFIYPANASVLLYQRIGSVITDRPIVFTFDDKATRTGVVIGDGLWKWRLSEYAETQKTEAFDEVFSKLIQYLSTREDKRRFRSFPISNEFTEAEPVVFESQVYNDLFEPIFGNTIQLEITNPQGKIATYSYIISKDGTRYKIGSLREGIYKFASSTVINGKKEHVKGEFLVSAQSIENQNLAADFALLQKLSENTGGKYFSSKNLTALATHFSSIKAQGVIHSEESYNPLINLKWVFFLLVGMITAEWLMRKYLGS
jgi:hypothetical protein